MSNDLTLQHARSFFLSFVVPWQRASRREHRERQSFLDPFQAHALIEIDRRPQLGPADLGRLLHLDQVQTGRLVKALERDRLVASRESVTDRRRRELVLTDLGSEKLARYDEAANAVIARRVSGLNEEEVARFTELFNEFDDALGAEPLEPRQHEHPLRAPVNRYNRVTGIFADRRAFNRHQLSRLQWHILQFISDTGRPCNFTELYNGLGPTRATLSFNLTALRSAGLLVAAFTKDDADGRKVPLQITAKGNEVLDRLVAAELDRLGRAFEILGDEHSREFVALTQKIFRPAAVSEQRITVQPRVTVEYLKDEGARQECRAFLIRFLVHNSLDHLVPAALLPESSHQVAARSEGALVGLFEGEIAGTMLYLGTALLHQDSLGSVSDAALFEEVRRCFARQLELLADSVVIDDSKDLTAAFRHRLGGDWRLSPSRRSAG